MNALAGAGKIAIRREANSFFLLNSSSKPQCAAGRKPPPSHRARDPQPGRVICVSARMRGFRQAA